MNKHSLIEEDEELLELLDKTFENGYNKGYKEGVASTKKKSPHRCAHCGRLMWYKRILVDRLKNKHVCSYKCKIEYTPF